MAYKYLTFDCYGTLVDWRTGIERELTAAVGDISLKGQDLMKAYLAAEAKEEATYKKYREVLKGTVLALSKGLGGQVSDRAAGTFAGSVPRWPAFPDTSKFLTDMGSRGYKRYILSNVDDDLLESTIVNNHFEVDGFVTAEQVGSYKPNPAHWEEFIRRTGASRAEILHVAQSVYHDIIPTGRLGIASAWVNRYREAMPKGSNPAYVTETLAQLGNILDADPA